MVHDQLQGSKAEANAAGQEYCEAINDWVDEAVRLLKDRARELAATVGASTQEYLRVTSQHMQDIRARRQHIEQLVAPLQRNQVENTSTPRLAQLCAIHQSDITGLLD